MSNWAVIRRSVGRLSPGLSARRRKRTFSRVREAEQIAHRGPANDSRPLVYRATGAQL